MILQDTCAPFEIVRFERNRGKGAAVMHGLRLAVARGFTHAVQLDADGQHDLAALSDFLVRSKQQPEAVITGKAVYDRSVPLGRAIGRWITHFWVWIETLSLRIPDTMCGFRIYPLEAVERLLASGIRIGERMEFDTEIAVRLFWNGSPVLSIPVRVVYPARQHLQFPNDQRQFAHQRDAHASRFYAPLQFPEGPQASSALGRSTSPLGHG